MGIRLREDYKRKAGEARKLSGCSTIVSLAIECEVRESTIYQFLRGERVSIENFQKICKRLGLNWREVCDPTDDNINIPDKRDVSPSENTPSIPSALTPGKTTPERPDGWVALDSPFYIQRPPKEQDCYNEICKPGSLIRIKAPKQMGKTSLMMRILHQAEKQGDRIVYLSLEQADKDSFSNLDTFLRWFCAGVGRKLKLENKLDEYWEDDIGCNMRCETYFEEYLLPQIDKPLTLGLDKIDRLFQYPEICVDFFGLLRYLHEEAKLHNTCWKKLRLVLAHSTEMYLQMDINRSPFNAGLAVELPEFTSNQVLYLTGCYQVNWSDEQVQDLMSMVGGHPFLVGLALYHIARNDLNLMQLLQTATNESSIYKDHLNRIAETLEKQPELVIAIKEVVTAENSVQLERVTKFKLQALGLVNVQNDEVTPRCKLYRQFFKNY
jgi:transcriptional regulator with XRE-family HTH domain